MKTKNLLAVIFVIILGLLLALVTVVLAQSQEKPYPEGMGYNSAGTYQSPDGNTRTTAEGMAGSSGTGPLEQIDQFTAENMRTVFLFSGVSDDGEQGSSNRKEATSIHCTNISTDTVQVEVQVFQWNGTDVYTSNVNLPTGRTFTFSTQNTTIYFDDILLGGSPGTQAIYPGHGRVLTDHPGLICTAQVLDPLGYPPAFGDKLPIYDRNGKPVKHQLPRPDLFLEKVASSESAVPGQPVTYTLTYANQGANIATQTVITDSLPAELVDLIITSNPVVTTIPGDPITFLLGDLYPQAAGMITVTGKVNPALTVDTTLVNTRLISGIPLDRGAAANEAQATVSVTLPRVSFAQTIYQVDEESPSGSINVGLSIANPYSQTTIDYQTVDDSAVAGEDYTAVSGELSFPPGQASQTISIPIIKSELPEGDERFFVELASPIGAELGATLVAEVIIEDNSGIFLPFVMR